MIQEFWNLWLCLNNVLRQTGQTMWWHNVLRTDTVLFFFSLSLFFFLSALFDKFYLAVLSEKKVHVKAAIKYVPVHHTDGFMEESKRDSTSLDCCFITSCSSLQIQLWSYEFMVSLLMKLVVNMKVNFYTFLQRLSVFTSVLLQLLCCKIHTCNYFFYIC